MLRLGRCAQRARPVFAAPLTLALALLHGAANAQDGALRHGAVNAPTAQEERAGNTQGDKQGSVGETPEERADFTSGGQVAQAGQVVVTAPARAVVREFGGQRNFGFLATGGSSGYGLGVRGGAQRLGLELSGTWVPLLTTYAAKPGEVDFEFFSTWQLNAGAYLSFYRSSPRTDMGVAAAYHYSSVIRHGAGLMFYAQHDLANKLALHFLAGPAIFPEAEAALRATGRFPAGGSISSGLSAVRLGIAVNLAFFP